MAGTALAAMSAPNRAACVVRRIRISLAGGKIGRVDSEGRSVSKQVAAPLHQVVPRKVARYGWRPDTPDMRDMMSAVPVRAVSKLPASVDLSTLKCMPPVYDQGQLGSCTGN